MIKYLHMLIDTPSGLPSPVGMVYAHPRQYVHDQFWGIMLTMDICPALEEGSPR